MTRPFAPLQCESLEHREVPSADVAAVFSTGLWKFEGELGTWAQLSPDAPTAYGLDDLGNAYAVYASLGLVRFDDGTTDPRLLNAKLPDQFDLTPGGWCSGTSRARACGGSTRRPEPGG